MARQPTRNAPVQSFAAQVNNQLDKDGPTARSPVRIEEEIMRTIAFRKVAQLVLPLALCALTTGCFSTVSSMAPGKTEWIQPNSDSPRAGNAYLFRGLIGLFSGGIDAMTVKINEAGIRAHVFQEDQHQLIGQVAAD